MTSSALGVPSATTIFISGLFGGMDDLSDNDLSDNAFDGKTDDTLCKPSACILGFFFVFFFSLSVFCPVFFPIC